MSETQILTELLENLRFLDENEQNIRTAEEKANNTENDTEKQTANDKSNGLKTAGTEIKKWIQKLREKRQAERRKGSG